MALERIRNLFCALALPVSIEVPLSEGPNPSASLSEAGTAPTSVGTALQHKRSGFQGASQLPSIPAAPMPTPTRRPSPALAPLGLRPTVSTGCGGRLRSTPGATPGSSGAPWPPASFLHFFLLQSREGERDMAGKRGRRQVTITAKPLGHTQHIH